MYWKNKLDPQQLKCLEFVVARPGTLIVSEVGTGKTLITLAAIEVLQPQACLIIAPLTSLDITWAPRIARLAGYVLCRSFDAFKLACKNPGTKARIILLLHYQLASKEAKRLARINWHCVVIDEAQGLKTRSSGWSRMARKLRQASLRIALTATPLDESPIDLFGIMRFVDSRAFGEHFKDFAQDFCYRGGYMGYKWIFNDHKLDQFLKRLKPYAYRLTKDYLGLPRMIVHPINTFLLGNQRRLYDELEREGIIKVGEDRIVAPRTVTVQGKLEQITGGSILTEDGRALPVGNAKKRKLAVLLPRIKLPVVIFCKFLHEINTIYSVANREIASVRILRGSVKGDDRTKLINDFQEGNIDALVCQVRTGGVSIEFTRSSTLIFYSMNFSLIDFEQIIGRFHRRGQTNEVNVYIIYAEKTVDEKIISDVEKKHAGFYQVVDPLENLDYLQIKSDNV